MKYLTTSIWALAAMGCAWLAYDYHDRSMDKVREASLDFAEVQQEEIDRLSEDRDRWFRLYGEVSDKNDSFRSDKDNLANQLAIANETIDGLIPQPIVNPDPMNATMKLMIEGGGHGSGTHIGGGFVITAGHVAEHEGDILQAKFWDGGQHEAVTLWSSETYDVALLKIEGYTGAASHLDCRTPDVGEELTLTGNPMAMEFVQTYAKVSSRITDAYASSWAEALPVDGAMGPGMSGGGAFDKDGDLLGVNVGIPLAMLGMNNSTFTGISFIVPASTICNLMGRS